MAKLCLAILPCMVAMIYFSSCRSSNKNKGIHTLEIRVPANNTQFSEIFEPEFEIIKLETTETNKIAVVRQTIIQDDHIFLLDNSNTISHFRRDGSFVNRLQQIGKGPGEYIMIMSFRIQMDGENPKILVNDPVNRKLLTYDLGFQYLEESVSPFPFLDFESIAPGEFVFYRGLMHGTDEEYNYDLILNDTDSDGYTKYLPYPFSRLNHGKQFPLVHIGDGILFHTNYSDTIYKIDLTGKVQAHYKLTFGEDRLPSFDYLIEQQNNRGLSKSLLTSEKVYSYVFNEMDEHKVLSYYINNTRKLFIEDKKGNQIYTDNYVDDFGLGLSNDDIDFFSENRLGFYVYPFQLEDTKEDSEIPLNSALRELNLDDNPSLVLLTLKKDL